MRAVVSFCLAAILALGCAGGLHAQSSPPSLDAYGRLPAMEMPALSPSGERLAMIAMSGGERSVVVSRIGGPMLMAMPTAGVKVRKLLWAGEDRLLVMVSRKQRLTGAGKAYEFPFTLVMNLATGKTAGVFAQAGDVAPYTLGYEGVFEDGGHWYGGFVGSPLSKSRGFEAYFTGELNLYKADLDTGGAGVITRGETSAYGWVLGPAHAAIAHIAVAENRIDRTVYDDTHGGRILLQVHDPLGQYDLIGPGRSPGTVIVDHGDVDEWSLKDGTSTPLPIQGDVSVFDYTPNFERLVAIHDGGDQDHMELLDPALAARVTAVQRAIPGRLIPVTWNADYSRIVLFGDSDSDAGTYWLLDGKAVNPVGYRYPDLPDAAVARTSVFTYKAADGLDIHAILTLPPGRDPKSLPVIVLPHGGPEAHDELGFHWWAQAFASRGYAVLQPNFRGSNGYGRPFRDAGFGEWGRKMQTDLSDGLTALAAQGVVDPRRACIVGASYGGYAALAAVTLQHGFYRCAVSVAGPSDLAYLLNEAAYDNGDDDRNVESRYWRKFIGAAWGQSGALAALSPTKLADQADAPILLVHGADDTVVPIGQSREMEAALKKAGKPVEFLLLPGEDHWLSQEATRKAMLAAVVGFVQRRNPAQ